MFHAGRNSSCAAPAESPAWIVQKVMPVTAPGDAHVHADDTYTSTAGAFGIRLAVGMEHTGSGAAALSHLHGSLNRRVRMSVEHRRGEDREEALAAGRDHVGHDPAGDRHGLGMPSRLCPLRREAAAVLSRTLIPRRALPNELRSHSWMELVQCHRTRP